LKPKRIKSFYLQIHQRNRILRAAFCCIFNISLLALFLPAPVSAQLIRKSIVEFKAADGLPVTADLYQSKISNPYIILFHQEQSSRGEFDSIASRFIKMNYNCMAVDLRSGDDLGFVKKETAMRAREGGYAISLSDAILDMEAAVEYLIQSGVKNISLFGSASSATLALIAGRNNGNVKAVVAFSPGDYFAPENELKNILANYPKPVFVATTTEEFVYLLEIKDFSGSDKILFKPESGEGMRGTRALLKDNLSRDEYWLSLLIFFKSLQ